MAVRTPRTDGRKRRWRQHKINRREELVDGTLAAVRTRGGNAGMDEIAAEIGVSKTVLYRYFSDKNDLVNAAMQRFIEITLMPRVYAAISLDASEYELARAALTEYVGAVDEDPEVYRFIMGSGSGDASSLAEFEKLFAEVVAAAIRDRGAVLGFETEGALLWSYVLVGGIQLATHWWTMEKSMTRDELIDYLTMMVWSAIEGMARAGGSRERFATQEHVLPSAPVDEYTAPADKNTAPAHKETAPAAGSTPAFDDGAVPAESAAVPAESAAVPGESAAVVAESAD